MRACYKNDPKVSFYHCAIIVEEVFLNKITKNSINYLLPSKLNPERPILEECSNHYQNWKLDR